MLCSKHTGLQRTAFLPQDPPVILAAIDVDCQVCRTLAWFAPNSQHENQQQSTLPGVEKGCKLKHSWTFRTRGRLNSVKDDESAHTTSGYKAAGKVSQQAEEHKGRTVPASFSTVAQLDVLHTTLSLCF